MQLDDDSAWQPLVQRAALARRTNDTAGLLAALEDILQNMRSQEKHRGERATRQKELDSSMSKEFGVESMTTWLCPLLLRYELATVAEELIEELAAAKKEEILSVELKHLGSIQLCTAKDVSDWTMADGRFIWHGAHACLQLIMDGRLNITEQRVLELGCGLGIVGLACAKAGARAVTLTDYDPELLSACSQSIALNCLEQVTTLMLDWQQVSCGGPLPDLQTDLILGADIIYDEDHAKSVLGSIRRLLREGIGHEGILITGEPEKRQGVSELDKALCIPTVSEVVCSGESESLLWQVSLLPDVVDGRRHRLYRFSWRSEPELEKMKWWLVKLCAIWVITSYIEWFLQPPLQKRHETTLDVVVFAFCNSDQPNPLQVLCSFVELSNLLGL